MEENSKCKYHAFMVGHSDGATTNAVRRKWKSEMSWDKSTSGLGGRHLGFLTSAYVGHCLQWHHKNAWPRIYKATILFSMLYWDAVRVVWLLFMFSMSGLSPWNTTTAMISLWVDFLNVTVSVKRTVVQIETVMFLWAITFVDSLTVTDVCRLSWSDLTRRCREQQIQFICGASARSVVKFVAFVHVFFFIFCFVPVLSMHSYSIALDSCGLFTQNFLLFRINATGACLFGFWQCSPEHAARINSWFWTKDYDVCQSKTQGCSRLDHPEYVVKCHIWMRCLFK